MHDTITGSMFKEMLLYGTASVTQAQQLINDLNVFPVPDGDTGTNMSLTIQAAAQELKKIDPQTVDEAASVAFSSPLPVFAFSLIVYLADAFRSFASGTLTVSSFRSSLPAFQRRFVVLSSSADVSQTTEMSPYEPTVRSSLIVSSEPAVTVNSGFLTFLLSLFAT